VSSRVRAPGLLDGRGIAINGLAAGPLATETCITKYQRSVVEEAASTVPLQRLGRPEELAWIATYLASEAGNCFSGSELSLDGARDVWRGSFPTRDYVDAAGSIVAEARPNGRSEERART
jgi:NAD(P)-dependent dehydrogenase (short-subunit alcohol dehydrogenase family)